MTIFWILLLTVMCACMGVAVALFIAHAPRLARPGSARFLLAVAFPALLGIVMATSAAFPAFLFGGVFGSLVMYLDLTKKAGTP